MPFKERLEKKRNKKYIITIGARKTIYQYFPTKPAQLCLSGVEQEEKTEEFTYPNLYPNIKDFLVGYITDVLLVPYEEDILERVLKLNLDDSNFCISRMADEENQTPSKEYMKRWQQDTENVFIQDNCVTVKINGQPVTNSLLYYLILSK